MAGVLRKVLAAGGRINAFVALFGAEGAFQQRLMPSACLVSRGKFETSTVGQATEQFEEATAICAFFSTRIARRRLGLRVRLGAVLRVR